jgi:hypothetical protein
MIPARITIKGLTDSDSGLVTKIEQLLDDWDHPGPEDRQSWAGYNPNRNKARVIVQRLRYDGDLRPTAKDAHETRPRPRPVSHNQTGPVPRGPG